MARIESTSILVIELIRWLIEWIDAMGWRERIRARQGFAFDPPICLPFKQPAKMITKTLDRWLLQVLRKCPIKLNGLNGNDFTERIHSSQGRDKWRVGACGLVPGDNCMAATAAAQVGWLVSLIVSSTWDCKQPVEMWLARSSKHRCVCLAGRCQDLSRFVTCFVTFICVLLWTGSAWPICWAAARCGEFGAWSLLLKKKSLFSLVNYVFQTQTANGQSSRQCVESYLFYAS